MKTKDRGRVNTVALRLAGVVAIAAWFACLTVCVIGSFFRHAAWVYVSTYVVGGTSLLLFAFVGVGLILSGSYGRRPSLEGRKAEERWWQEAPVDQRVLVVVMVAIGLGVAAIGALGSAFHAELVAHAGAYFVQTDGVRHQISEAAYYGYRYSQSVLFMLGPAMVLCGFVRLIVGALGRARSHPYETAGSL